VKSTPRARCWGCLLAALTLAGPAPAEPTAGESRALALGVAPFQVDAPPGAAVPDVATLLADRLGTRGAQRVVGPSQLGVAPAADADPEVVRAWIAKAQLDAVVVGRTTRIGNQLSVDVRLSRGDTGEVARTFIQEIASPEDLEQALDGLALRVLEGAGELFGVAAAPDLAQAPPGDGEAPFGFRAWDSDEPLSIESGELEAVQKDGRRQLIFTKNVRVLQGELRITAARLEAIYPEKSSQPDRLVASGDVTLAQGDQNARCDRALYDRLNERLTCRGHARFEDGDNRLSGDVIEIDLRNEKVSVKGGASVLIQPEELEDTDEPEEAS
jgi:lipopolysaccharide export system protein LptA